MILQPKMIYKLTKLDYFHGWLNKIQHIKSNKLEPLSPSLQIHPKSQWVIMHISYGTVNSFTTKPIEISIYLDKSCKCPDS